MPRKILLPSLFFFLLIILVAGYKLLSPENNLKEQDSMKNAAIAILQSFDAEQKAMASFKFDDDERMNWHYTPVDRKGVPFRLMNEQQREKVIDLLNLALTDKGLQKAKDIMILEGVLGELEGRPAGDMYRHPENYFISIFGDPSSEEPWGWRFEGHHLSLNFTSLTGEVVSLTPNFYGANPAKVPTGEKEGWRVLKEEEDVARKLLNSLDESQKQRAIILETAPRDMITAEDRRVKPMQFAGLKYTDLNANQQSILKDLVLGVYFGKLENEVADVLLKKINNSWEDCYFAWAGSEEIGEAHYYRIHHPKVLIEYDNTQNDANHIHTVVRDIENDFGEDVLKKHYQESGHHH